MAEPLEVADDIGERLRELRRACGWTQAEFATVAGRTVTGVSYWERGIKRPPKSVLARLAAAFGWPVEMFTNRGPRPEAIIQSPVALPGSVAAPLEFPALPDMDGKGLTEVYQLALNDVVGWTARRADLRPAATRANQLIAAVREAALRDAATLAQDRAAVERALQVELRVAQDRLRDLQTPRKRPKTG